MTQVWMVRNSDTDIHLFNRFEHLEPSVATSYSRCKDVSIKYKHDGMGNITFTITGLRGESGFEAPFEETIVAKRYPVWTEPCHL